MFRVVLFLLIIFFSFSFPCLSVLSLQNATCVTFAILELLSLSAVENGKRFMPNSLESILYAMKQKARKLMLWYKMFSIFFFKFLKIYKKINTNYLYFIEKSSAPTKNSTHERIVTKSIFNINRWFETHTEVRSLELRKKVDCLLCVCLRLRVEQSSHELHFSYVYRLVLLRFSRLYAFENLSTVIVVERSGISPHRLLDMCVRIYCCCYCVYVYYYYLSAVRTI